VWTAAPGRAEALLARDDPSFLRELEHHFGTRTSCFLRVADRRIFPLALEFAPSTVATRCVVLGNAAQALHPVAGQFNLGRATPTNSARDPTCRAMRSATRC
jgi:2-octaprenyl-6-methoxyphenol hydroxylase